MPTRPDFSSTLRSLSLFACIALLAWLAYQPGLTGAFLFDDFVNLNALGAYGPVDNWPTFWRYITSGTADPTGRPVALLTFLLDANNWPADPYPFKRTNVLLHIFNGGLLFWLLACWGRLFSENRLQAELAAAFGAGVWMLHPLLVSTTLYIVQREAMLPATFVLLGLLMYTKGYLLASRGVKRGLWLAAASTITFTVLAILSKANGALLPVFIWLADRMVLSRWKALPPDVARTGRKFKFFTLTLPAVLLFVYLGRKLLLSLMYGAPPHRPWTVTERLMTESRIFFDYLELLWFPRPYTSGLFNDGYTLSHSLLAPPGTLISIFFILAACIIAIIWRRRFGMWAFAFLFFVVGHIMETGVLLLELYYEHRNYLPSMVMFWPLGLLLTKGIGRVGDNSPMRGIRILLLLLIPLLLSGMTWARSSLWGDHLAQARAWVELSPDSPRARAYAAQFEMQQGDLKLAISQLQELLVEKPNEVQLALNLIGARCLEGGVEHKDLVIAMHALETAVTLQRLGYEWFDRAIPLVKSGACPGLDAHALEGLISAAMKNERAAKVPSLQQDLYSARAQLALVNEGGGAALLYFDQAYDVQPRPGAALAQAAQMATAGFPLEALAHLDRAKTDIPEPELTKVRGMASLHRWLLARQGYWYNEFNTLECTIAADVGPAEPRLRGCESGSIQ